MSKLLIQESPLTFQPSLAVAIGLNEAIVLQQIHYWITNQKNKGYEQDGYKWVYNTYAEWKETNFPFWSENTIQRTFASLEEKGLVVSIQPMKSRYDRTKYYRIDHTKLEVFDDPKLVCSLNESEITAENTTSKSGIFGFMEYSEELKNKQEIDLVEQIAVKLETGLRFNFPRSLKDQQVYKRILKSGISIERFIEWVKSDEKRLSYAFLYAKDTETIWRDLPQINESKVNRQNLEVGF